MRRRFAEGGRSNVARQVVRLSLLAILHTSWHQRAAYGKNVLPRVAAKLGVAPFLKSLKVESADLYVPGVRFTLVTPSLLCNRATPSESDHGANVKVSDARRRLGGSPCGGGIEWHRSCGQRQSSAFVIAQQICRIDRPELKGGCQLSICRWSAVWVLQKHLRILEPLADKLGAAMGIAVALTQATF